MAGLTTIPSKDAALRESAPTTAWGGYVYNACMNRDGRAERPIYSFDISSISGGSIIGGATLTLVRYLSSNDVQGLILQFCKMTQPTWVEAEATWNIYKSGTNWDSSGGDYVTTNPTAVEYTFTADSVGTIEVDITTLVQDALDNSIDLHILRKFKTEGIASPDHSTWYDQSKENAQVPFRPKLVVTYNIGRRYWWVEDRDYHFWGESGAERKLKGAKVAEDKDILVHLNM